MSVKFTGAASINAVPVLWLADMKQLLFVDDEVKVLDGLRRMLRPLRTEWAMEFTISGRLALALLAERPFDVIVTDMRMPDMDGAQLLEQVRERFPKITRVVLTGQCSRDAVLRLLAVAHRHLIKPCDAETLKSEIARTCALRELLNSPALLSMVSKMSSVPSLPALYIEVNRELETKDFSLEKVGEIIGRDIGMTAKIMQVVNSAFFGLRGRATDPVQALKLLGSETTKILVLAANVFSQIDAEVLKILPIDDLWNRCRRASKLAALICQAENADPCVAQFASMAGMLQDTGRLVLATHDTAGYAEALRLCKEGQTLAEAERRIFGAAHAEVGAYLLGLWGLPEPIVEVIAWHHAPAQCPATAFGALTAVHVANALLEPSAEGPPTADVLDMVYLERLALTPRLEVWRKLVRDMERGKVA